MFSSLTNQLQSSFRVLSRRGKLRSEDVDAALREIRLALLDADVNYQVVRGLLAVVRERALSEEVSRAMNPSQQVIRIIYEEMLVVLGDPGSMDLTGPPPRVVLLVGLQGSGKTTTAAKLARWLRSRGERVWMIAADPYRPAASDQLETLGEEIDVPVYSNQALDPVGISREGLDMASRGGASVVIIDSAGRSQLDDAMMSELNAIDQQTQPREILLVADAMTGQEAVQIAQGFNEAVGLTGIILTKMDGDARGGAAISMRAVTQVPIKWIGVGEDRSALEQFDPERLASRIMGMGDLQGILEVAQEAIDLEQAEAQAARLMSGEFTLEDFALQLQSMRKMGPIGKILERMPASMVGLQGSIDNEQAERQIRHTQAILQSMTREERRRPDILNGSRKRRIAAGSGTSVQQVNVLLRQYKQMRRLMKQVGKGGLPKNLSWPS